MITKKDIYGWNTSYRPNTFIGGVGNTISTKGLLATKLGISVTRIKSFRIVNNEVQACIEGNYVIPGNCFQSNTDITWYKDNDRLVYQINNGSFVDCPKLEVLELYGLKNLSAGGGVKISNTKIEHLYFPEMTSISGNNSIQSNSFLKTFDAPIATSIPNNSALLNNNNLEYINIPNVVGFIGSTSADNNTFGGCKAGCVINVHISMMTNTGGLPDADLRNTALDVNYIGYTPNPSNFNTEIGGVALTLGIRRLIGEKLGIGSARIVDFSTSGSDVRFRVLGAFTLPTKAFENNSSISKYLDHDGLAMTASTRAFYNANNLTSIHFPALTSAAEGAFAFTGLSTVTLPSLTEIGNQMFNGCPNLKYASLPVLVNFTSTSHFLNNTSLEEVHLPMIDKLGNSVLTNSIFNGVKSGCKIYVPQSMMTINSGMPDGDLLSPLLDVIYLGYVDNYDNYNTEIGGLSAIMILDLKLVLS